MIYEVKVKFSSTRKLSKKEIEDLLGSIELQVIEPQDRDGEDARYGTVVQEIMIEGEGEGDEL